MSVNSNKPRLENHVQYCFIRKQSENSLLIAKLTKKIIIIVTIEQQDNDDTVVRDAHETEKILHGQDSSVNTVISSNG